MKFAVDKMTCAHCARTVTDALQGLDPNAQVRVDLAQGSVDASGAFTAQAVVAALAAEGYPATLRS